MSKKVKILVSALVIAVLVTVGTTIAVIAQEESTPSATEAGTGLMARVATILEIDEETLIDAFKQAREEMRQDAFIKALEGAVEKGYITQGEADEIEEWWGQKPEVLEPKLFRRACAFRAMRVRRMGAFRGWGCPELPEPSEPVE